MLVVIALVLPVLVGAVGLSVDIGDVYYNWVKIRSAADAAALAGSNYLPSQTDKAISTANTYALDNGLQSSEIQSIQVDPNNNKKLIVNVQRDVPTYFLQLLSTGAVVEAATTPPGPSPSSHLHIQGIATAVVQPLQSASTGVVPFGVDYTAYTTGQVVTLMLSPVGPGNWDALALGGNGADNYKKNVQQGYQGSVSIGDFINTETGNMVGPTRDGVNYRLNQGNNFDPSATYAAHQLNDPRVFLVPMVDWSNVNGKSQVPVKGFAQLWLISVDGHGNITTYFIQQCADNANPSPTAPDFGAYSGVLIQ